MCFEVEDWARLCLHQCTMTAINSSQNAKLALWYYDTIKLLKRISPVTYHLQLTIKHASTMYSMCPGRSSMVTPHKTLCPYQWLFVAMLFWSQAALFVLATIMACGMSWCNGLAGVLLIPHERNLRSSSTLIHYSSSRTSFFEGRVEVLWRPSLGRTRF